MNDKVQFTLTGFTQKGEFRVFTFESAGAKKIRVEHRVQANITLIRKYSIALQDLPLLCRSLLERPETDGIPEGTEETHSLTYTEEEMRLHASNAAIARREAAARKKPPRRPAATNLGSAWRDSRIAPTIGQAEAASNNE